MNLTTGENQAAHLRIRPVEVSHVGDLIRLGDETNLSPWTAQGYIDEMKNTDAIMLRLVSEENMTIGFIVGRTVIGGAIEPTTDAEIYNIAVAEIQQRQGCGQMLFDAFMLACSERGVANVWLEVRESNQRALSFYERNGFVRVQTRPFFYDDPREHAVLMKLRVK